MMADHFARIRNAAVLLSGVALALVAGRDAFVFAKAEVQPERALALAPAHAGANATEFDRLLSEGFATEEAFAGWSAVAKASLAKTPLHAPMLRIMAMSTTSDFAEDVMKLSARVSRRDLLTQIWLIEDAVSRDDLPTAVKHYDKALSVFPAIRAELFEVLNGAIENPEVRTALAPYVAAERAWVYPFLNQAVSKSAQPVWVADLLNQVGNKPEISVARRAIESRLLAKLVSVGEVNAARDYAKNMGAGSDILDGFATSRSAADPAFVPLAWSLTTSISATSSVDIDGSLQVSISPATRARVAQRVVVLKPGTYSLAHAVEFPSLSPKAYLTWQAFCLRAGERDSLLNQPVPAKAGRHIYQMQLDVPTGCAGVEFVLMARGEDAQTEASATLSALSLSPQI